MEILILLGLAVGVMSSLTSSKDETKEDTDTEANDAYDLRQFDARRTTI